MGGVVAASHPLAAEAGATILRQGGNAVDAAAAVQFALNVVEPLASGIGGGAFILVHLARGGTQVLDCRETAPGALLGWPTDSSSEPGSASQAVAGATVGTPGTVRGWSDALQRWGSLPLSRVLIPAIDLAEAGVPTSQLIASRLPAHAAKLRRDPLAAALFLPGGRPLAAGECLVQPELARTFRLLAGGGPGVFYEGEIARAVVSAVQARGGCLELDDLATYRTVLRTPLWGSYRGYRVATMPPPGAGPTLLHLLGLLEPFDLPALGLHTVARVHLELQAMRLGLVDRAAYLADPDYAHVPVASMLQADYLDRRRALITSQPLGPAPEPGALGRANSLETVEHGQTTHFVTADDYGNLVSCTSTIEDFFGSGIMVPGYGFLLNNECTDFDPRPGTPNQARPGARPASSMVPTLVFRNERPWLALGSPGGPTIVTAVLQVLLRVLNDGLSLRAAVDAPRYFAAHYPRFTWEPGLPAELRAALADLRHRPASQPTTIGSVQALEVDPLSRSIHGVADDRRDGAVVTVR